MKYLLYIGLVAMPAKAMAATLEVPSLSADVVAMLDGVVTVMQNSLIPVCIAAFLYGAFRYTISVIHEESRSAGKGIMIGALTGVAIGFGAQGIMNLVLFFLYG